MSNTNNIIELKDNEVFVSSKNNEGIDELLVMILNSVFKDLIECFKFNYTVTEYK